MSISKNLKSRKVSQCKTSIEDLEEEGYIIGRKLGEGSYSEVRLVTFQGEKIAVKIITKAQLSEDFQTKFLPRELKILSKIKHPNIVHVHKIFKYPRRIFIFTELIDRGDLLQYIKKSGRLMEHETHHFFKQMVSAVQYLHSLNVAHRDLKCENIMINDEDQVKIIDFGFCRSAVSKENRRILSRTYCGSTAYASPEVLQGIPYNPMMYDVWSLGCVLYIMVTGTMPFDDTNLRKMVFCQLRKEFKYPQSLDVKTPLKELISRMLEPDVTKRANMNQVSENVWVKKSSICPSQKSSTKVDNSSEIKSTVSAS